MSTSASSRDTIMVKKLLYKLSWSNWAKVNANHCQAVMQWLYCCWNANWYSVVYARWSQATYSLCDPRFPTL